ncbi:MAG: Coenzyme F420 hydrogenase/dehydrogenase, beta subunit C-terminal domain [Hyphomicrobiaceae bacterium]
MPERTRYSLDEIVENGLCMGCGICRSVLGAAKVTTTLEADGLERPRALKPFDDDDIERLNAICPGVHVSFPDVADGIDRDPMWGPIARISRGYASDPAIRYRAASGGALTGLGIHLIETRKVDYIMHLKADPDRPLLSKAHRSYTRDDVISASGSRYTASAPLASITEGLDEGRPFAFIGKPCDVTALANLARQDTRVGQLCRYTLTIVCGGFSELSKFRDLLAAWDMDERDVTRFSFRGNGCPGPTAATTKDGRHRETAYWELWAAEETWRNFYRCKICPDAIGLSADLAALDVWDGCNPTREDAGWNAFLCRTGKGRALLEDAVRTGHVTLDAEWTTADLDRAQPHQTRKRRAVRARYEAMRLAGAPYPVTEDPGLDLVSLAQGSEDYGSELAGTAERLRRDAHRRG